MTFRARNGSYLRERNGRFFYRRTIPARMREYFGAAEWVIEVTGNPRERSAHALTLASTHDRQMRAFDLGVPNDEIDVPPDLTLALFDIASDDVPEHLRDAEPERFWRDGKWHDVYRYGFSTSPRQRREAEAAGYFVMSPPEAAAQQELQRQLEAKEKALDDVSRELAELKAERAMQAIDAAAARSGETVLSILDRWRAMRKQSAETWKKHVQYANEFAALHGDPPLTEITKAQIVAYVEWCQSYVAEQTKTTLSPTSIAKRLDSVRALMSFAVSVDAIQYNPATGVRPPKDPRPKTARSWKSFEKEEVRTLVTAAADIWGQRRKTHHATRVRDLQTALAALIWTGARPEEICQLRRTDVDTVRGAISITNDESDDDARPRITKNDRSIRVVPIHPRLLPDLEAHLRCHNGPLLFPSFEPKPSKAELAQAKKTGVLEVKGRYSRPIIREWTDHLRTKVTKDPRKVLYSLRHSWAAESRRTGMPEHVRNALMGHADDNQHASRYGGDADWLEEKRRYVELMHCL